MHHAPGWDLYCRVIDNFGDVGVCWRLAADLAARGQTVRLFIDDASALDWMAPAATRPVGVQVLPFDAPAVPAPTVVEAFGCRPPEATVQAMADMAHAAVPPVWINLEYLSAEAVVDGLHGLPSPQNVAGGVLMKWFFYPGFTPRSGGLLREGGLGAAQRGFDATAFLQGLGVPAVPGERRISLFCYDNPRLSALLQALAADADADTDAHAGANGAPRTRLLVTPGIAQRQVQALPRPLPAGLVVHALPWLAQPDYDRLLWACDLNFVRGEDSLVRAHWAGRPFVWQAYPQHDGVHADKLQALLQRLQLPPEVAGLWRAWNGLETTMPEGDEVGAFRCALQPPAVGAWQAATQAWSEQLRSQADLTTQLLAFAAARRLAPPG